MPPVTVENVFNDRKKIEKIQQQQKKERKEKLKS